MKVRHRQDPNVPAIAPNEGDAGSRECKQSGRGVCKEQLWMCLEASVGSPMKSWSAQNFFGGNKILIILKCL